MFPAAWDAMCGPGGVFVMLDAMFLAVGFGFLAAAVLYVTACDRL
jgi:hypothetical protein